MATDNTPQGIVADKTPAPPPSEQEVDAVFDEYLDDLDGGTGEEPDEQAEGENPDEQPDEADVSEGEEDEPEEGDDDRPRDDKGRFVSGEDAKVKLPDGSVTTVKDLIAGSLRQADYTKKTQDLSAKSKAYEERIQSVEQLAKANEERLQWAADVVRHFLPKRPDPSERHTDPIGYEERKEQWEDAEKYLASLEDQRGKVSSEQQAVSSEKLKERIPVETQRLTSVVPELADPKRYERFKADAIKIGSEVYGLNDPSLEWMPQAVYSSHFLHVMNDALNWQRFKAQKAKAQEKAAGKPPVTPGRRQTPEANGARSTSKALQTLKSTGGKGQAGEAAWDALADRILS